MSWGTTRLLHLRFAALGLGGGPTSCGSGSATRIAVGVDAHDPGRVEKACRLSRSERMLFNALSRSERRLSVRAGLL